MGKIDLPISFGGWLKHRRRSFDLTQSELAERAGCSVFALREIESGERQPSKQLAELLARSLEISPDRFETFLKLARLRPGLETPGRTPCPPVHLENHPALPSTAGYNFPTPLYPFIGREREVVALSQLIKDRGCRLLTLTGSGGSGKTRLAIEVATRNRKSFPDGVYFLSLAEHDSSGCLIPAFAESLGVSIQCVDDLHDQLLFSLQKKQVLLLIDNVEHLAGSLDLVEEILDHAPGVKLLVASRERLNCPCEQVFEIEGLSFPPVGRTGSQAETSAERLFVQVARRAGVDFKQQPEERPFILRICQILEGMPLGIELAAARVRVLSCREIAQEMERDLDFLHT